MRKIGTPNMASAPPFRKTRFHAIPAITSLKNLPDRTIIGKVMLTSSHGIFSLAVV